MARLWMTGAEIDPTATIGPDTKGSGTVTRDTATFRSGLSSAKCDSTAGNVAAYSTRSGAATASRSYFLRVYFQVTDAPSADALIIQIGGSNGFDVKITTGRALQLFNGSTDTQIGSDSSTTLAAGTWYRVELSVTLNGSTEFSAVELRLDGVTVASTSGLTIAAGNVNCDFGWPAAPGASKVIYWDDAGFNDSTGASNNTWLGEGSVILMKPISDNSRGQWTAGAGGTTNLFNGVDNTPPVGVADGSATDASQIKIKSTTLPSNCDLNLATYTAAGVTGTVNAIQVWCNDGEDPGTGTKTGSCAMVSNPAIAAANFPNFGDDVGAQGTYAGNWKWHSTLMSDAPSVTLGTAPVIRVSCATGSTGTRAASCDFLGAYVDFTPTAASSLLWQPAAPSLYGR